MTTNTPCDPLDCESARLELPVLLSEELDAPTKRQVEAHLTTCAACRDEVQGAEDKDGL